MCAKNSKYTFKFVEVIHGRLAYRSFYPDTVYSLFTQAAGQWALCFSGSVPVELYHTLPLFVVFISGDKNDEDHVIDDDFLFVRKCILNKNETESKSVSDSVTFNDCLLVSFIIQFPSSCCHCNMAESAHFC